MKPESLFWIELVEDLRHRKSLMFKFVLPVILTIPFALPQFTSHIRYAGLSLIALFLGVLGSSAGLARMKERGILERLSILPQRFGKLMRDFLFANVAMDLLQMAAPIVILAFAFGLGGDSIALASVALVLSVLLANTIGVLVATAAGGSGEVHLYSAICVLFVAGLSGTFSSGSGGAMQAVSTVMPFDLLTHGLSQASVGDAFVQLLASSAFTLALTAVAILGSERFLRR